MKHSNFTITVGGSESASTDITWYDSENDRLIFDSFGNTLNNSNGTRYTQGGHVLRPFPSPGTSPNLELGLKNFIKQEEFHHTGLYNDYLSRSSGSMYLSGDIHMGNSVSTPNSSDSFSSSSSHLSQGPLPANVIQATPVMTSTHVEKAIPSIPIPMQSSHHYSSSNSYSNILNILPGSQRNVLERKTSNSAMFRSMSSPEISQGAITVATVLETPSMDRKIYVATPVEYDMQVCVDDNDSTSTEIDSGHTLTSSIVFRSL